MPRKSQTTEKIEIPKEKLRPRPRSPILPTKEFEDKRRKEGRRAKHKKDLREE